MVKINSTQALELLGKIDGGIAAAAASWGAYDKAHMATALAIAGIAGGLGIVLNAISHAMGGQDVAPTPAPDESHH